ncbi:MAG: FAD:protein FMN transferase [Planctomycetales bacterium]
MNVLRFTMTFSVCVLFCCLDFCEGGNPGPEQLAAAAPGGPTVERFSFREKLMGVPCDIALYAPSEGVAITASRGAFDRIKILNSLFSDYEPESELMQFSRTSGQRRNVALSPELFEILQESQNWSRETEGAFDVTVGPLVQLWRKTRRQKQLPPAEVLQGARARCGFQALKLDAQQRTGELTLPKMQLDLGGIAKGYAAQAAIDELKKQGITRALVAMAGDIVASDPPPGKDAWRVGIGRFDEPEAEPDRFLKIKNQAVSTSGDAFQVVVIDGTRYAHIIDPKTGLGLPYTCSVTVIAPQGSTADALGTALSIMPVDQGLKLVAKHPGVEALIIRREGERTRESASPGFGKYLTGDSRGMGMR